MFFSYVNFLFFTERYMETENGHHLVTNDVHALFHMILVLFISIYLLFKTVCKVKRLQVPSINYVNK